MKEQIEQILGLAASGKLTGPQAAELITELTARATPEPARAPDAAPGASPSTAKPGLWSKLGLPTSHTAGLFASDLKDNDLSMSSVDLDQGEGQVFRDNTLSMSSLSRISLVRSEMTGNSIGMSSLENTHLEDARFTGCELQKSSIDGLSLRGATALDLAIRASSLARVSAGLGCSLRKLVFTASNVKGLSLEDRADWQTSEISGSQVNDTLLRGSTLESVDIQAAQLSGVEIIGSRLGGSIIQGIRLKKVRVVDSVLADVLISGGDSWRRSLVEDVRIESCKLHRGIFSECRFVRTILRNVDASELKVHRLELVDQVIDGTEAFLAAISASR